MKRYFSYKKYTENSIAPRKIWGSFEIEALDGMPVTFPSDSLVGDLYIPDYETGEIHGFKILYKWTVDESC